MTSTSRICPHCGEIFERRLFGINLFVRRFERCPACGKWVVIPVFARKRESPSPGTIEETIRVSVSISEAERLRQRIEESKYE